MPDINTPAILTTTVPGDMETPSLDITFSYDRSWRRYMPASVKVENPMSPFTMTTLKKLPIHSRSVPKLRETLGHHNEDLFSHPPVKSYLKGSAGRAVAQKAHQNPSEHHLIDAALIYMLAAAVRDFPVKAVERSFGLDNHYARAWLKLARQKGLLP